MSVNIPKNTAYPPGSYDFSNPLYTTYVKWDGTSDAYRGETTELTKDKIYRVIRANILSSRTYLYLEEIDTGKILSLSYNSTYFKPLRGNIGFCPANTKFSVGSRVEIEIFQNKVPVRATTSAVKTVERVSSSTINIITENSVYTCFLI